MLYALTFGGIGVVAGLFYWSDRRAARRPRWSRERRTTYIIRARTGDDST